MKRIPNETVGLQIIEENEKLKNELCVEKARFEAFKEGMTFQASLMQGGHLLEMLLCQILRCC